VIVEGRAWLFAEPNLNTDLMMPGAAIRLPIEQQITQVFAANRPGWADQVRDGDVLVGGRNFGTGSSRPAAALFRRLGIRALVADSVNELFYRNCVNYALPALECRGIVAAVTEGDVLRIDVAEGAIVNLRSGETLRAPRMPPMLIDIIAAGGLRERLRSEGYI
jgi:3-isopropylmalate/(R)-2-methylmalate dehydratase small subunit